MVEILKKTNVFCTPIFPVTALPFLWNSSNCSLLFWQECRKPHFSNNYGVLFFCYSLRACSSHIYTDISVLDWSLTLADFSMNHRFSVGVERKYRRCVESHGRQTSRITTAHPSCIGIHEPSTDIVLTCFFPSTFSPNSLSFLTQTFRKFDSVFGFITDTFSISPTYACCWEDVGAERLSWGCLIRTLTCEQGF